MPFGDDQRAFLQSRPVAFVFLAGWQDGLDRLAEAAKQVGIDATVFARIKDNELPFAFPLEGEPGSEAMKAFKEKCRLVGADLLASLGKSDEKQKQRALGYGNKAMLLATRLNVPTQTLTCIWNDGQHDGVDWHALLRRRPKN